ncbi:MAG: electron transfer flavoprotein subunit alpha/FixB family protein [Thermoanaerobaculia bacterium]
MAKVCAVLQQREGKIHRMAWETVAAAQQLAALSGEKASAVVLGSGIAALAGEVAALDLDSVRVIDHPLLADYTPGGYVAALAGWMALDAPSTVLFPHTYQTVEYMPRLALASGAGIIPEGLSFVAEGGEVIWKRPILEGKMHARVRARGTGPVLVSLQSGAFSADSRKAGQASVSAAEIDMQSATPWREILGVQQMGGETVDLTKAEIIVAIGRGIGGADKLGPVEELARLLKADIGASRPVIDSGWLPRDRQIGSSGQTVSPKLYMAFGISGAIQHLVGMKGSSCIVAINKDAGAPIFKIANYGIVGDLHEVIPAMVAALKQA